MIGSVVVAGDSATRFQRHGGMAADSEIEFQAMVGSGNSRIDVAIGFSHNCRFRRVSVSELPRQVAGVQQRVAIFDFKDNQFSGVLSRPG